jgi:hypothetical protein
VYCNVCGGTRDENNGLYFGWLDLISLQLRVLLAHLIQGYRWFTHFPVHCWTHTLGFPVFPSRILATDRNTETSTSNVYKVFLPFLGQSSCNLGTELKLTWPQAKSHSLILLYPLGTDHAQKTQLLYCCMAQSTQKTRVTSQTASSLAR